MPHFNEHALEMAIMELFEKEGYICTNGEEVHKEDSEGLLWEDLFNYIGCKLICVGEKISFELIK